MSEPLAPPPPGAHRSRMERWDGIRLYTVGHSTRQLDELVELLRSFGVGALADIRTIPRSRRNPQFDIRRLAVEIGRAHV